MAELTRDAWVLYHTGLNMFRRSRPGMYTKSYSQARLFTKPGAAKISKSENEVIVRVTIVCNLEEAIAGVLSS